MHLVTEFDAISVFDEPNQSRMLNASLCVVTHLSPAKGQTSPSKGRKLHFYS